MKNTNDKFLIVQLGKPKTILLKELIQLVDQHIFTNYPKTEEPEKLNKWFSEFDGRIIPQLTNKYPKEKAPFFYTYMCKIRNRPKYLFYRSKNDWLKSRVPFIIISYN
jgi:hypothetical protein